MDNVKVDIKDLHVGMNVIDDDNVTGEVRLCDDIHNVWVTYDKGGSDFYCLDEDCVDYEPLYLII